MADILHVKFRPSEEKIEPSFSGTAIGGPSTTPGTTETARYMLKASLITLFSIRDRKPIMVLENLPFNDRCSTIVSEVLASLCEEVENLHVTRLPLFSNFQLELETEMENKACLHVEELDAPEDL